MRIYGLKSCDTCRAARKALPRAEFRDVRDTPLTEAEVTRFWGAFGEELVNRRSTTWRGLSEAERAEAPLALLGRYPALMKRPVIEDGDRLWLGWSKATQEAVLG